MKLGVRDRIALLSILPEKGDFLTIKIVRQLREALSFTEDEHAVFGLMLNEDGSISWKHDDKVDVPVGPKAHAVIVQALEAADREKRLNDDHIDIYEMFMGVAE